MDIASIGVIGELERIGWDYEFTGDDELKCKCPAHDDKKPSCSISIERRAFKCHSARCGAAGDFITFLATALKTTRQVILVDLAKRYGDEPDSKIIKSQVVERYHAAIWVAKPLLKALKQRGITDDLIREYRLGFCRGRITIPITNDKVLCVNLRRYLPDAPDSEKMINTRGYGQIRLFPVGQLQYNTVVVCGGEIKAIVVADRLNQFKIGAITATAGEGNWHGDFTKRLSGKQVYVCLDIDESGKEAAKKLCLQIRTSARWVGNVALPLDTDTYPHGDVNDWLGPGTGATAEDFKELLESTSEWLPPQRSPILLEGEHEKLPLKVALGPSYVGKPILIEASISAIDTATYVIPRKVSIECDRSQPCCGECPAFSLVCDKHGICLQELPSESPAILEIVDSPKNSQRGALMDGLGIPLLCKAVKLQPSSYYSVEEVRISPRLEIANTTVERLMRPAVCVGCDALELNESYSFSGRVWPHPKDQQAVLVVSNHEPLSDALSSYNPNKDQLRGLMVFQPDDWTVKDLHKKFSEVYEDIEQHVTRIFKRRDLHMAIDLAFHSPLLLHVDGKTVRGWVEVLVVGDSSQGKSETAIKLIEHYQLGERTDCKNASVAGLLGGLQKFGDKWLVMWGVIPTHDRRLVILDELKGADVEVIAKLTDMRSSGIAEIPKIERRRTHARTRIVALSNPRSIAPLSSYGFGVEAITELIGSLEDIRRFDFTLLTAASDVVGVDLAGLQSKKPTSEPIFTSELCRKRVLWAWTRKPSQVGFTEAAQEHLLQATKDLCHEFTDAIPLIDSGSMRYKLSRLAASVACMTFSTNDAMENVLVRDCHVIYIKDMLRRVYSSNVFGYLSFSKAAAEMMTLTDPQAVSSRLIATPFPDDLRTQLLHTSSIELRDLCDWCGYDKLKGIDLMSFLVRKHALHRSGRAYRKTPKFIDLLRGLDTQDPDRDLPHDGRDDF